MLDDYSIIVAEMQQFFVEMVKIAHYIYAK
jgi:hypothetical protein